ncbi:hypothetical protein M6B38_305570 [Iris pallida]|uniref:Uncharacterized protein n=1 Tax=Iris pallida TaxID=29817 RepID=A0AAX6HKP8_IRIPA|nr:hypothetical protein M6B38_305570 [Iris pallida]
MLLVIFTSLHMYAIRRVSIQKKIWLSFMLKLSNLRLHHVDTSLV